MSNIAQFAGEVPTVHPSGWRIPTPTLLARLPGRLSRIALSRIAGRVRQSTLASLFVLAPLISGLLCPAAASAEAVRYPSSARLSAAGAPDTEARTASRQAPSLPVESAPAASREPGPISKNDPQGADSQVTEGFIAAPLSEVWDLFTTADGHRALGLTDATVDLRIGGEIRSHQAPQDPPGGSETIVHEILAYEPERMLALRIKQPPPDIPHPHAVAGTWSVIYFSAAGENMTQVRIVGLGYGENAASQATRRFFAERHRRMLDHVAKAYWPKCAACTRDPGENAPE